MATKPELLAQAKELGLDVTEDNTVAEISAALNAHADANPTTPEQPEAPAADGDVDGVEPPEGTGNTTAVDDESEAEREAREAAEAKAAEEQRLADQKAAEAKAAEDAEVAAQQAEQARLEAEAKAEAAAKSNVTPVSAGSEIASAIVEGLKNAGDKKRIKFASDRGVQHRFSVVKNKQGEIFVRENATQTLSRVQLESLEEKEASIQGQEVEDLM